MKHLFILLLCLLSSLCLALNSTAFGPPATTLNCTNMCDFPLSFGGELGGNECVFLYDGMNWNTQVAQYGTLPVVSTCMQDENNLLAAMGMGTYSDGIYRLNLNNNTWSLCDWFIFPTFVTHNPAYDTFYCGDRDGLYKSANCTDWYRISALGSGECSSIAFRDSCIVVNRDAYIYYSHDNGLTWQQSQSGSLSKFRYSSDGVLWGVMNIGSDSDGLWCSYDNGETWQPVYYSVGLTAIGPDFNGYLSLGWESVNEVGSYVALLSPAHQLIPLIHSDLSSPVKELENFPLVNTLSIYVLNGSGGFFLTDFLPVTVEDPMQSPVVGLSVYPNPASATVQILGKQFSSSGASCEVYNIRGQLVHSIPWTEKKSSIEWNLRDVSGKKQPAGIYILKLRDAHGNTLGTSRLTITE